MVDGKSARIKTEDNIREILLFNNYWHLYLLITRKNFLKHITD